MNRKSGVASVRRKIVKPSLKVTEENNVEDDNGIVAQSPIALFTSRSKEWFPKVPLGYKGHWNCTGKALITNNGVTALMTFVDRIERPLLYGGPLPKECIFEQLHFHWAEDDQGGSEHSINGVKYAAEAHLVHYNSKYDKFSEACTEKDGLAVTGFLLKVTDVPNPSFQLLSDAVAQIPNVNQSATFSADCLRWMLSVNLKEYYTYHGSLTTEPFLESVTWIVYPEPVEISFDQLKSFRKMEGQMRKSITCNARVLQPCPSGLQIYHVKPKEKNHVTNNSRSTLRRTCRK